MMSNFIFISFIRCSIFSKFNFKFLALKCIKDICFFYSLTTVAFINRKIFTVSTYIFIKVIVWVRSISFSK